MTSVSSGAFHTTILTKPGTPTVHTVCPKCGRSEIRDGDGTRTGSSVCTWGGHAPVAMVRVESTTL